MLGEIKKELINHPDKLQDVLEYFGYCHVLIRPKYMQFGRDEYSSKKSIVIKLDNNDYLYVHDYARNINKDLFSYIMEQRKVSFVEVLTAIKNILNIADYYTHFDKRGIFGGFYERVRKRKVGQCHTYDESVLNEFVKAANTRFLKDNISIEAQRFFGLRYDIEAQGIVIPIYNQLGQLIGAKERLNFDPEDGELKYFYPIPCSMSSTLYGYSHNYNYLSDGTVLIFESEKSTMQCFSYGIRNCVSLGSGSICLKQVQMLMELNPKRIIFMHDVGYQMEYIQRNIDIVMNYSRFKEIEVGYWDFFGKAYKDKVSPSDMGKEQFMYILKNEIKMIGGGEVEDEL